MKPKTTPKKSAKEVLTIREHVALAALPHYLSQFAVEDIAIERAFGCANRFMVKRRKGIK